MKSTNSTPSSAQKPKPNHLDEFLPFYKKLGENNPALKGQNKTSEKHDSSSSKLHSESPKHPRSSSKRQGQAKPAVEISRIIIDGTNLNTSEGRSTPGPLYDSKVTHDDVSAKSQKRTKSVSFLLEENDQEIVKKPKSDDPQDGVSGDTPNKVKKHKYEKEKKSEKENKVAGSQMNVVEPAADKKDRKFKNKSITVETAVQSISDIESGQGDSVIKDKKIKKRVKGKKQENPEETKANQVTEKKRKAKKQKYQDKPNIDENGGEPASKSPKTEAIADNLENLNLGDNTHTLANLINEMAVVDKAKQKKVKKTANREKKHSENQNMSTDKNQDVTEDFEKEGQVEKKKWMKKRWNKRQIAEKDPSTIINVDNLPVALLKGNFKKVLIDYFAKYGLSRSVGEPIIQNEEAPDAVFTSKVFFDTAIAAAESLEMDQTTVAGNEIQLSQMRPMSETAIVLRMYGHPEKLNNKDVMATFRDVGLIRSIRPIVKKKKTMAIVFVEFDGPETVERALQKCDNLKINGIKVTASQFVLINNENKDKINKKKRKRSKVNKKGANKDSGKAAKNDSGKAI